MISEAPDSPIFHALLVAFDLAFVSKKYLAVQETQTCTNSRPYSHLKKYAKCCEGVVEILTLKIESYPSWLRNQCIVEKTKNGITDFCVFSKKRMRSDVHTIAVLPQCPGQASHRLPHFEHTDLNTLATQFPS